MISVSFTIITAGWLNNPNLRWNAGLEQAGLAYRQALQNSNYGNGPKGGFPETYQRTGTLASKANSRIVREGAEMQLYATGYLLYLLLGTGIYGPRHSEILPVTAPAMVWQPTLGDQPVVKAQRVRGTIWNGKLEELIQVMQDGFKKGVKEFQV